MANKNINKLLDLYYDEFEAILAICMVARSSRRASGSKSNKKQKEAVKKLEKFHKKLGRLIENIKENGI